MKIFASLLFVFAGTFLFAQTKTDSIRRVEDLQNILNKQTKIARIGLTGLTTWAAGNMLVGGLGMAQTKGEVRSFHEMNFFFNTVNLTLGGLGILSTYKPRPADFKSLIEYNHQIEKVYLFNIALDLGYMASGWAIYNKGLSQTGNKADQNFGYGKSLVLQGGFLAVYDIVIFSFYRKCRTNLDRYWPNIQFTTAGLGIGMVYSLN